MYDSNINFFSYCFIAIVLGWCLASGTVAANSEPISSTTTITLPVTAANHEAVNSDVTETNAINAMDKSASLPLDLVDERPSALGTIWIYSTQTVKWVWNGFYDNVIYWVAPPSPTNLMDSISKEDAAKLFKLLKYAGYKLKMIDTDVGIIPGFKIKFGQVRELSEADLEYLEIKIEEWEQEKPGIYDAIQRSIVKTVLAINASSDYRVTSLEVKLLPLPDVAFTMIPKKVFLGEESSVLMRAIQRVERGIRVLKEDAK